MHQLKHRQSQDIAIHGRESFETPVSHLDSELFVELLQVGQGTPQQEVGELAHAVGRAGPLVKIRLHDIEIGPGVFVLVEQLQRELTGAAAHSHLVHPVKPLEQSRHLHSRQCGLPSLVTHLRTGALDCLLEILGGDDAKGHRNT